MNCILIVLKKKHHIKDANIQIGDWVRIKLGTKVKKGESKFSQPLQVVEVYSKSAKLSDNKVWYHSRMAMCKGKVIETRSKNVKSPTMDWLWDDVIDREKGVSSCCHDGHNNSASPSFIANEPSESGVRVIRAGRSVRIPPNIKAMLCEDME